jgi:DNA-binding NarL/FixJ family response regulator
VATWIGHIASHPGSGHATHGGTRRRQAVARPAPTTDPSPLDQLTVRERDVLELMAHSRTNEEIAADLFIAMSTVKTHVNHILRKLDQPSRLGAVLEYQRLSGLVDDRSVHPGPLSSPPSGTTQNPPWV